MYEFKESDAWDFARGSGTEVKRRGDELQFLYCPYCRGGSNRDKGTFSINLHTGQHKCLRSSCSVSGNMITLAREFDWFSLGSDMDEYYKTGKQKKFRQFKKMKPVKPKPAAIAYLENRGISAAIAEKYQITVQKDRENILVFPFLDERGRLQFVKYRKTDFDAKVDTAKEWCEANCKPILFGMYQCDPGSNKTLILTEGQIDSLSVAEAGLENAVSVPTGKNGFTWVPYCWDWMGQFDTLVVFGDNERGEITLLADMRKRFRGMVKAVRQQDYKNCKDANELLLKHGRAAVRAAVEQAEPVPVQQVKELADVQSVDLFSLPKVPTGVRSLDKVLSGGIYLGQTVVLTGKRGDGKSTFASQILANALDAGKSIFAYSGELPDYFFKRWIDFQIAGKKHVIDRAQGCGVNYYIPKEATAKIAEWYRGRAYLFDNQASRDDELESLLEIIEKAVQQYGIELVLLDNLMTALDVGMNVDLYRAQSKFVDKLVKMAKRQQVAVILVVHPRKNKFGNDDTDEVNGSADITNKADIVMTYKRDKALPDEERVLTVSKNRLTGNLAVGERAITLYYDPASKRISDDKAEFERQYGWEKDNDGFIPVTAEQIEQMEIPFE